jgi:hypothetical protein
LIKHWLQIMTQPLGNSWKLTQPFSTQALMVLQGLFACSRRQTHADVLGHCGAGLTGVLWHLALEGAGVNPICFPRVDGFYFAH